MGLVLASILKVLGKGTDRRANRPEKVYQNKLKSLEKRFHGAAVGVSGFPLVFTGSKIPQKDPEGVQVKPGVLTVTGVQTPRITSLAAGSN